MTEQIIPRVFKYKELELPDPNPKFTIPQVLDFYSNEYPEFTNATHKEAREQKQITITIENQYGTKG